MERERETILLVDPSKEGRQSIENALGDTYYLLQCGGVEEAEPILHREGVDLLLIDETCSSLVQSCVSRLVKGVPYLIIGDENGGQAIVEAFASGAVDFIRKPLNLIELGARVEHALEERIAERRVQGLVQELQVRSERDPLTDVFNRFGFQRHAMREVAKVKRSHGTLSLLMMDIDKFKGINDQYGHLIGDEILLGFTLFLGEALRKYDILSRYGGDEFVVILPHTDEAQAKNVAERILEIIRRGPHKTKKGNLAITTSIGMVTYHPDSECTKSCDHETVDRLLATADQALYQAKELGRNRAVAGRMEAGGII